MRCQDVQQLLVTYLDGEVTPAEKIGVEAHLHTCESCRADMEALAKEQQTFREAVEVTCTNMKLSDEIWNRIQPQLVKESQPNPAIFDQGGSTFKGGVKMVRSFISRQPKWKIATAGVMALVLIIVLSLTLPSSPGQPNPALAAEIATNSLDVKAILGDGEIQILKTEVSGGEGTVVCMTEMHYPISVTVDLEAGTVTNIENIDLPRLTEAEKEAAIEIAVSDPKAQEYVSGATVTEVRVFPYFKSFSLYTEEGQIKLLPDPKMAMVELELEEKEEFVRAGVNLDAKIVWDWELWAKGAEHPSSSGGGFSSNDPGFESIIAAREALGDEVIEIAKSDTKVMELLDQGFTISPPGYVVFWNEPSSYWETEDGKGIAVSTVADASVQMWRGDETWTITVNVRTGEVEQYDYSRDCVLTEEERWMVLRIIETDPDFNEILNAGARISEIGCNVGDPPPLAGKLAGVQITAGSEGSCYFCDDMWGALVDIDKEEIIRSEKLWEDGEPCDRDCELTENEEESFNQIIQADSVLGDVLEAGGKVVEMHCTDLGIGGKKVNADIVLGADVWKVNIDLRHEELLQKYKDSKSALDNREPTEQEHNAALDIIRLDHNLSELLDGGATVVDIAGDFRLGAQNVNLYFGLNEDLWKAGVDLEKQIVLYAYKSVEAGEPFNRSYELTKEEENAVISILETNSELRKLLKEGAAIVNIEGYFRGLGDRHAYLEIELDEDAWRVGVDISNEEILYLRKKCDSNRGSELGEWLRLFNPVWSPDGNYLAFLGQFEHERYRTYLMNADGTDLRCLPINIGHTVKATWSPDSERIAFVGCCEWDGTGDIYVMKADGTGLTQLTNNLGRNYMPIWSPDGQRIAFVSSAESNSLEIYVMNADGTNITRITHSNTSKGLVAWSSTGEQIVFRSNPFRGRGDSSIWVMNADGSNPRYLTEGIVAYLSPSNQKLAYYSGSDIYIMDVDGSNQNHLTDIAGYNKSLAWSSDGKRIAFVSQSGADEEHIWIIDADSSAQHCVTNTGNNSDPAWSPDGKRIAFISLDGSRSDVYVTDDNGDNRTCLTCNQR